MSEEWETKALEECILRVTYPEKVQRKAFLESGAFPIVSQEKELINGYWNDGEAVFQVSEPIVIFGDHTQTLKFIDFDFVVGADGVKILKPREFLDAKFFYYFLQGHPVKTLGYARHCRLLKKLGIRYPPLAEQKRIVAILDEAFEGIDRAVANTEQNLANARALFESHLNAVFSQEDEAQTTLQEISEEVTDGDHSAPPKCAKGVPFVTISNIDKETREIDFSDTFFVPRSYYESLRDKRRARKGDILYTVTGSFGIPVLVSGEREFCFQRHIGLVRPKAEIESRWLYYALLSPQSFAQANDGATGAAQKTVSLKSLRGMRLPLRNRKRQVADITELDRASQASNRLAETYRAKLTALADLKQSILHKAFSGALTADKPAMSNVVAFPKPIPGISKTDLHAGILALAYRRHDPSQVLTFGEIKAEKTAHMIEAYLGIDLDRNPVKDAAGPNDYPHLKKIESRAHKAGFFVFKRTGRGHVFEERGQIDKLIEKTSKALGDRLSEVEALLDRMASMKTSQAEIFATVFAGWNNLLIDGLEPTDEEIVTEARENWHPEKLEIDRERFFKAIEWMRHEGFVPSGRGKQVLAKATA